MKQQYIVYKNTHRETSNTSEVLPVRVEIARKNNRTEWMDSVPLYTFFFQMLSDKRLKSDSHRFLLLRFGFLCRV